MRAPTTRVRSESEANLFFHPLGEGSPPMESTNGIQSVDFNFNKELSLQIQIGSRLFPEYAISIKPIRSDLSTT